MISTKRVVSVVIFALLAWLAIAIYLTTREPVHIPPPNTLELDRGKAQARRAHFASWEFRYDKATTATDGFTQTIDHLRDGIYYKGGKPYARMRADRIVYNQITNDFTAQGNLHITVDDHGKTRRFDTSIAQWQNSTQHLNFPREVHVGSEGGADLTISTLQLDLRTGDISGKGLGGGVTP